MIPSVHRAGDKGARRPLGILLASGLTGLFALGMAVMAVLSVTSNPNLITLGIAVVLLAWAALLGVAARGMLRGRRWSRGPVVAGALLHLGSFGTFVPSQPLALIPAAMAMVIVVAAVLPSSTEALHLRRP